MSEQEQYDEFGGKLNLSPPQTDEFGGMLGEVSSGVSKSQVDEFGGLLGSPSEASVLPTPAPAPAPAPASQSNILIPFFSSPVGDAPRPGVASVKDTVVGFLSNAKDQINTYLDDSELKDYHETMKKYDVVRTMRRAFEDITLQAGQGAANLASEIPQTGTPFDMFSFSRGIAERTRSVEDKYKATDPEWTEEDSTLSTWTFRNIPTAIGQTAGFALAKNPYAIAGFGSLVGSEEYARDAQRFNATPEQVFRNRLSGLAFGATEGIMPTRALKRVDDLTGGSFTKALSPKKYIVREMALEAMEEGLQEAAQAGGLNLTARYDWISGYDPTRKLSDHLLQATGEGAATGAILSALGSLIGLNLNRQKRKQGFTPDNDEMLPHEKSDLSAALESDKETIDFSMMDVEDFLSVLQGREEVFGLTDEDGLDAKVKSMAKRMNKGERLAPIWLASQGPGLHNGKARALAAKKTGITFIPVYYRRENEALTIDELPVLGKEEIEFRNAESFYRRTQTELSLFQEQHKDEISELAEKNKYVNFKELYPLVIDTFPTYLDSEVDSYLDDPDKLAAFYELKYNDRFHNRDFKTHLRRIRKNLQLNPEINPGFSPVFTTQTRQFSQTTGLSKQTKYKVDTDLIITGLGAEANDTLKQIDKELKEIYVDKTSPRRKQMLEWRQRIVDNRDFEIFLGKTVREVFKPYLNMMKSVWGQDLLVIMGDNTMEKKSDAYGWAKHDLTNNQLGISVDYDILRSKLKGVYNTETYNLEWNDEAKGRFTKRASGILHTMFHEIGHNFHMAVLNTLAGKRDIKKYYELIKQESPDKVEFYDSAYQALPERLKITKEETDILEFLENSYYRKLVEHGISPVDAREPMTAEKLAGFESFSQENHGPNFREIMGDTKKIKEEGKPDTYKIYREEYMFNIAEFYAEAMAKQGKEDFLKLFHDSPFVKNQLKLLKTMFEESSPMLKKNEDFDTFLTYFTSKSKWYGKLAELRQTMGKKSALDKINDTISLKEKTIPVETSDVQAEFAANPPDHGVPGLVDDERGYGEQLIRYNKFYDISLNLLQFAKINPTIAPLQQYVASVQEWKNFVNRESSKTEEVFNEWRNLGKDQSRILTDIFFEEANQEKRMSAKDMSALGLSDDGFSVYDAVRGRLDWMLEELKASAIKELGKTHTPGSDVYNTEFAELEKVFSQMKAKGYFPFMRFGEYTLKVIANRDFVDYQGLTWEEGALIEFQGIESKGELRNETDRLRKLYGNNAKVTPGKFTDITQSMQQIPRHVFLVLKKRLGLSPEQESDLMSFFDDIAPFKTFKKHLRRKKKIHGYSEDAIRSFASYMRNGIHYIGKINYGWDMRETILEMKKIEGVDKKGLSDNTSRDGLINWMNEHYEYITNPVSELQTLRSLGFFWFLGFNAKSAALNSTQVPLVAWPFLSSKYKNGNATKNLAKAYTMLTRYWRADTQKGAEKGVKLDQEIVALIDAGIKGGWIDQSLATELAIAANQNSALDKSLPNMSNGKTIWYKVSQYGSMPFHLVEVMNRHVVAIAAYLSAKEQAKHDGREFFPAEGIAAAADAVRTTQYEYEQWNRPKMFRGRKSAIFLFMNYPQNTLFYLLSGQPGWGKFLAILFLFAGGLGLPGAENLVDIADYLAKKFKEQFGYKNPYSDLRTDARKFLKDMGANPDLVLHGTARWLPEYLHSAGVPMPDIDMSSSISMGRILPFTESLKQIGSGGSTNDLIASLSTSGTGALGTGMYRMLQGITSNEQWNMKRAEKLLPTFASNASKAVRQARNGGEYVRSGEPYERQISAFNVHDTRDQIALTAQAFGFPLARTNRGWEAYIAEKQVISYWTFRQTSLLRDFNVALDMKDKEAIAQAKKNIISFNKSVPYPSMSLNYQSIISSRRSRVRQLSKSRQGMPNRTGYIPLARDAAEAYSVEEVPKE